MSMTLEPAAAQEAASSLHPELRLLLEGELEDVVYHLANRLVDHGYTLVGDGSCYLFGVPPAIDGPLPMLVAHYDTLVPKDRKTGRHLKPVTLVVEHDVVYNANGVLGADDRAGVFAVLQALDAATTKPFVLFTNGEEAHGWGVKAFIREQQLEPYLSDITLMLEPDRKGFNEYVYYSASLPKETQAFIEGFGFFEEMGSYSDVADLTDAYAIPHANLSVGYFDQHTPYESLNLTALARTVRVLTAMVDAHPPFARIETRPVSWRGVADATRTLGTKKALKSQAPLYDWREYLTVGEYTRLKALHDMGVDTNVFESLEEFEEAWSLLAGDDEDYEEGVCYESPADDEVDDDDVVDFGPYPDERAL